MLAFGRDLEVTVSLAGPGGLWHNTSADVVSMHWNSECEVLTRGELTGLPATSASLATYNQTI